MFILFLYSPLRTVFANLQKNVTHKFGDLRVRYLVVAGLLFSRLFCVALLSPKLFGLAQGTYHTLPYHTIPYHTIPYHTTPHHTTPHHTTPHHTTSHHLTSPHHNATMPNKYIKCSEVTLPCRSSRYKNRKDTETGG